LITPFEQYVPESSLWFKDDAFGTLLQWHACQNHANMQRYLSTSKNKVGQVIPLGASELAILKTDRRFSRR